MAEIVWPFDSSFAPGLLNLKQNNCNCKCQELHVYQSFYTAGGSLHLILFASNLGLDSKVLMYAEQRK